MESGKLKISHPEGISIFHSSFSTFNFQLSIKSRMNTEKKSLWSVIIKVVIAVASAVAGALGISACNGL